MSRHPRLVPASIRRPRPGAARGVAWLVIVALLGLMAMPMVGVADAGAEALAALCIGEAAVPPDSGAGGQSVPTPQPHQKPACPFCLAHAGGFTLPPPVAAPPGPVAFTMPLRPALHAGITPRAFFRTGCQSRAPPPPTV